SFEPFLWRASLDEIRCWGGTRSSVCETRDFGQLFDEPVLPLGAHLSRRKQVIEHEIDDDSGYRYIQPQRIRPACDCAMLIEALAKSAAQGNNTQGNDGSG